MDQGTQRLIRRHNAQMRDLIVRDIAALEDKLNVKRQVSNLTDNAVDTVKGKLGMNNRNPNESWVDFVRHNAAPLAAFGFGGAVLAKNIQSRVTASDTTTTRGRTSLAGRTGASVGYPMVGSTGAQVSDSGSEGGLRDTVGSKLSGVTDTASEGIDSAKSTVSDAGQVVGEKAGQAKEAVTEHAMHAKDVVVERIPSREEASRMAHDHSQLLGAAALAAGAIAGAFVPRSRAEERRLAPVQSSVREKASELADQGMEKAKETADRATEALGAGVEMAKEEFADTTGDEEPPGEDLTTGTKLPDLTTPNRITGSRVNSSSPSGVTGSSS